MKFQHLIMKLISFYGRTTAMALLLQSALATAAPGEFWGAEPVRTDAFSLNENTSPKSLTADASDAKIQQLANNLGGDPLRIYEWVKNNIQTEFYLGVRRGAAMALLEQAGNDADQCALLGALLKSAGLTPTYHAGQITMRRSSNGAGEIGLYEWLGVDSDAAVLAILARQRNGAVFQGDQLSFTTMWVGLDVPGRGTTKFVPTIKRHFVGRRPDLDSISGFNLNTAYLAAGATATGASSPAINASGLRTYLVESTIVASNFIRQSSTLNDLSGAELARVRVIIPELATLFSGSTVNSFPSGVIFSSASSFDAMPATYEGSFLVTIGTAAAVRLPTSQLAGRRLACEFDGNGTAILRLENEVLLTEASAGSTGTIKITVRYDRASAFSGGAPAVLDRTVFRQGSAVLLYSFGRALKRFEASAKQMVKKESTGQILSMSDRLHLLAEDYSAKEYELSRLGAAGLDMEYQREFLLGLVFVQSGKPVIDLQVNQMSVASLTAAVNPKAAGAWRALFLLQGALEGAVVEQATGARAFGAPTLFDSVARGGQLLSNTNYLSVVSQLQNFNDATLGAGALATIQSFLDQPISPIAPGTPGNNRVFVLTDSSVGGVGAFLLIGQSGNPVSTLIFRALGGVATGPLKSAPTGPDFVANPTFAHGHPTLEPSLSIDPVDLATGAFVTSETDLALGNEQMPIGLHFERSYNSALRDVDTVGLGRGWTHNFDIRLQHRSPSEFDIFRAGIDEVLPILLALRVTQATLVQGGTSGSTTANARDWLVASTATTWGCDQQLGTRTSVTLGARPLEFVKRPDGSFSAPAGVTASLVKQTDGSHVLSFRNGNSIRFHPFVANDARSGKFQSITDQFANTLSASYGTQGKLLSVTDARDRVLTFTQPGTQLTSVSDSTNRTVHYVQDAVGLKVTDTEGKTKTYERDGDGRLTKIVDARNRTIVRNFYDAWHRVKEQHILGDSNRLNKIWIAPGVGAEVDPSGKPVWTYFDTRGRKVFVVNEAGKISQWHYDGADRLTDVATPMGFVTSYTYNADHNVVVEENPARHTRTMEYDAQLRPWKVKNFEGQITEFTYNDQHKVEKITAPGGIVSEFYYHTSGNGQGRLSKVRPAAYEEGKFDHYTYDAWGNLDTVKRGTANPGDTVPVDDYTYTARGDLTQLIDRRGAKTTFTYNQRRQLTSTTQWDGVTAIATVTTAYDDAGDVDYVLDASDRMTDTEHNALGDVAEIRQGPLNASGIPVQVVLENSYNVRNLLEKSIVPYDGAPRTTTYTYHDTKALKSVTNPLGNSPLDAGADTHTTTFEYDDDLRRTNVTTPLGFISTTVWDSRGFKDGEDDGENPPADYTYDKDGRLDTLANRLNRSFRWTYDDANRKVTTKTPLLKTTVSILNTRGLPASIQKPSDAADSPSITFDEYDAEGRLKKKTDGAGQTSFTYWPNGLLHTVTETPKINGVLAPTGAKTTTRTYDALNRLASYDDGEGNTIGYTYHPSGELHTLTYPGDKTVTYTYDDFGRLYQVKDWRATNNTTTYTYWENGLLKKIERPNATVREQSYDSAGRLRFVRESKGGVLFAFQELTYDDDGRIKTSFLHPMPAPITLPQDDMLFDADNRLSRFNGDTGVTYDADGNLTRGPALAGGVPGSANFTYDARNRLTSHGGAGYRYNPDGLRVEVTGNGAATYVVDPNAALTRTLIRTKNGVTTYYIYGLGLLYECDGAGNNAKYYHADQVGSTVALTNASGDITDRWSYAPFGTEFRVSGTSDTPFRFNGEFGVMTEASGLVYMRARYYHPRLMRFLNADPIGFGGGVNWYAAFGNNPISIVDPLGLWNTLGHNSILGEAFSPTAPAPFNLTPAEGAILRAASVRVDQDQGTANSFMHGMRAPGQTVAQATALYDGFLADRQTQAVGLARAGDRAGALNVLGEGMHALMDSTSPAHEGFQEWAGLDGVVNKAKAANHARQETWPMGERRTRAVDLVREYLQQFLNAIAPPNPNPASNESNPSASQPSRK